MLILFQAANRLWDTGWVRRYNNAKTDTHHSDNGTCTMGDNMGGEYERQSDQRSQHEKDSGGSTRSTHSVVRSAGESMKWGIGHHFKLMSTTAITAAIMPRTVGFRSFSRQMATPARADRTIPIEPEMGKTNMPGNRLRDSSKK